MKKYGKVLISEAPKQTTELLKKLCTDYRPSNSKPLYLILASLLPVLEFNI